MVKKKVGISVLSLMISLPGATVVGAGAPIIANAATTAQAASTAADTTGPDLTSSSLSVTSANVGDKVTITAKVTDPSGVGSVQAELDNINGTAQRYITLTYDQASDTWTGTYTVAANDPDGLWLLDFNMYDSLGNMSYMGTSNSLQINNPNGDTVAPTIGTINITPQPVQAAAPLTISAAVTDNNAVGTVTAVLYSPSNLLVGTVPLTYDSKSGQWVGTYTLDKYAEAGNWTVEIDATDTAGNFSFDNTHTFSLTNANSDTAGPVIGNVTLNQTTVKPNDTLSVSANLSDAVSGVSDAYVTLWSPSGANYSYLMTQDQTTGLWNSNITIPGTFEPGTWTVDVTSYDVAGNSTTKSGVGTVTVQNTGDYTPPTVTNIQATAANGQVTFSANVTDDKSTVSSVTAELQGPNGTYRYANLTFDQAQGVWTGTYNIQQNDEPGTWTTAIIAQDSVGNVGTTPGQNVTIANANYDGTPPVLDGVQLSATSLNVGDNLKISVTAHDDKSGVGSVQGWLTSPSGVTRFVDFTYDSTAKQWVGTYSIQQSDEPGTWTLSELDLTDVAGNTNYATTTNTYTVVNANPDSTPPVVDSSSLSAATAAAGDQVNVTMKAHDDISGVANASADFTDANGNIVKSVPLTQDPTGQWVGTLTVDKTDPSGKWGMDVYIGDNAGNVTTVPTTNTITIDSTTIHSAYYGDANYYFDAGNYYNAVYYAGQAIAQGDTRPEVQTLMNNAAQSLLDAAATMSSPDNTYAYQLLVATTGVPASIQSAAQAKLTPAPSSSPNYDAALWYNDQKNYYNAVYYSGQAINTDKDTRPEVQTFLNTAAAALLNAAATDSVYNAQNDYQLLVDTKGVPADTQTAAQAKLTAIGNYAQAQWYNGQTNYYNAVYFAGQALATDSHTEVQTFQNTAAQALFNAAATGSITDAQNAYQLLATTNGVPSNIKTDSNNKLTSIAKYADAQWYNDQKNYYNAVALSSAAIADGITNPEVQTFLNTASQSLLDAAATMSSTDAANAYQLLVDSVGVPQTIKDTATAKLAGK